MVNLWWCAIVIRPGKTNKGVALLSSLGGVERADSYCTGVGAPNAPTAPQLAEPATNASRTSGGSKLSNVKPILRFTSLSQFGPRVELYRGRYAFAFSVTIKPDETHEVVHPADLIDDRQNRAHRLIYGSIAIWVL